jgi:carbamoyl-phosphate synthase / aspartate carbamoyltransferase
MSKGYQTRRMAVDYQVPLVTNVKNAKILIEAIARHFDLEVKNRDFQTSHRTVVLPGLINIAAFVPGIVSQGSHDLQTVTKTSVASGFTMVRVMPLGVDGSITDAKTLSLAQQNSKRGGYCDYNFSVSATSDNANQITHVTGDVGSLFVPFNHLSDNINKVAAVMAHFDSWPTHKPILTDAKTTDLASILLLASLHNRRIHVSSVTSKEDIHLITLSKQKGLNVTCDVSIYSLYLSRKDYPECQALPTLADQKALWDHLEDIDVFSIGSLPYQLAHFNNVSPDPSVGIADALPLLLTSVTEGKLTVDDIKLRLYDNPKEIFELHEQVTTSVEVEIDRPYTVPTSGAWSPFAGKTMRGSVQRVTLNGKTVCLDGEILPIPPLGKDMSTHGSMPPPMSPAVKPLTQGFGFDSPLGRRQSSIASQRPLVKPRAADGSIDVERRVLALGEDFGMPLTPQQQPAVDLLGELLRRPSSFKNSHVLSVRQYNRSDLHLLFTVAQEMRVGVQREGVLSTLKGRVLTTLFYEPSTRTSASFDAAMQRLGGRTIAIATSQSSVQKGETLQDTLRTLGCYGDAIVLRHPQETSVDVAKKFSPVPVINGGNGSKEHPTQAFLDLFTIREEVGTVSGLTITFVGDLLYGRPVHSLVYLLQHYQVKVQLVSPKALQLPAKVREQLVASGQLLCESEELTKEIIERSDVLYCTRIQKERFPNPQEYEAVKDAYRIDNTTLKHAKSTMAVLHPLPRNEEVAEEVDFDQRAAYFRQVSSGSPRPGLWPRLLTSIQMRYGLYCRMALLALVMSP